jgi:PKD repeat protein
VFLAGTSMAAPQVAGLAAMLYATGLRTPAEVLDRMEQTADDLGPPGRDLEYGFGRINAYRAITQLNPDAPPLADAGGAYQGLEGSPVQFDGSRSADPNQHPLTFAWLFGDGTSGTGVTTTKTYADNGVFDVSVVVSDESKRSSTAVTTATIENVAPTVAAALDAQSILSGATVNLSGSYSDPGVADAPWLFSIDWGNGTTNGVSGHQDERITETRRYCAAGSYPVRLTVTDKDGGAGSADATIAVERAPVAVWMKEWIDPRSEEDYAIAIYSSATFDATQINPWRVTLGNGHGADVRPELRPGTHQPWWWTEDEDGDGFIDMRFFFRPTDLAAAGALPPGTEELVLLATMKDRCMQLRGTAPVRPVRSPVTAYHVRR